MRSAAFFDQDRDIPRPGRRGRREGGRDRENREHPQGPEPRNGYLHDDRGEAEGGRGDYGRRGRGRAGRGGREARGEGDYGRSGGGNSWQGGGRSTTSWEYVDPDGEVRGPFTATEINSWHEAGYFNDNLSIRMAGTSDFRRLAVVLKGITREAQGGPPAGQEGPVRGRGGRGGDGSEGLGGGRGPRARREPGESGSRTHPAEALSGRGEGSIEAGRGGRGRGPRGGQLAGRESERSNGGYGARDGDGRPRRGGRQPRSAKGEQDASEKGQLLYPLEVARRLFTGQARQGAEEPVWRYIDLSGNVQGPFTAAQMLGWYESHHLVKMDLRLCGTERKVSPPNLPKTDLHYEEFGRMLRRVQGGQRFKPVSVNDIENGTVPTYPEPPPRDGGRGLRERRETREPYEPRRERAEQGDRGERRERGERSERSGRGRRGKPADGAEATPGAVDAGAVSSPRAGRGGRGRSERAPRSEQAGGEETGGPRRERRRERRGGRGGRRGDDKVEVALKVVEDGMVALTITPVKPPPRPAAEAKPSAAAAPAAAATGDWGALDTAEPAGDWGALDTAEPAKGDWAPVDVSSPREAKPKEESKKAAERAAVEPAAAATAPKSPPKGDWGAVDVDPGAVQQLPQPVGGAEPLAADVAAHVVAEPVEVAPLLPADKPKSDEPAAGSAVAEAPSAAPPAVTAEEPEAAEPVKQDSFDLLAAGKADSAVTPPVEPAVDTEDEALKPLTAETHTPAVETSEATIESGSATPAPDADNIEPAKVGKPTSALTRLLSMDTAKPKDPDVSPPEPTDIAPGQPGEAGSITQTEAETTSRAAELSAGLDSLDKVGAEEAAKEPAAEEVQDAAEEPAEKPAKEQESKSLTALVQDKVGDVLNVAKAETAKLTTKSDDAAGEAADPETKEPGPTKEATSKSGVDASSSDKESASSSDAPKKKTGFMASLIGRFEK